MGRVGFPIQFRYELSMCLYIFAYKTHPDYPLILAGNRDEFYDRPTAPLHFWQDYPQVLGGRDLERKGTWLGMTRQGRIAVLTNFRDGRPPKRKEVSRGLLVSDFLTSNLPSEPYLKKRARDAADYPGYNLLVGGASGLWYFSNRQPAIRELKPGVHGLSNHLLDTAWPKLSRARSAFESTLKKKTAIHLEDYIQILSDQKKVPDNALPQTGVDLNLERLLASIFVTSPDYGTRSSSVILVDRKGEATFFEQTWHPGRPAPLAAGQQCYRFRIEALPASNCRESSQ